MLWIFSSFTLNLLCLIFVLVLFCLCKLPYFAIVGMLRNFFVLLEKPFIWVAEDVLEGIIWYCSAINECEKRHFTCCWEKPDKVWCSWSLWVNSIWKDVSLRSYKFLVSYHLLLVSQNEMLKNDTLFGYHLQPTEDPRFFRVYNWSPRVWCSLPRSICHW